MKLDFHCSDIHFRAAGDMHRYAMHSSMSHCQAKNFEYAAFSFFSCAAIFFFRAVS